MKLICKICKKKFKNNHFRKTCSKDCFLELMSGKNSSRWKGGKIEKKCLVCGEVFFSYPSFHQKSCSKKCAKLLPRDRKYHLDETFFQDIQTENQAYWLGFILADGCISHDKHLIIRLASKDLDHLKKFRKTLKGNQPIKDKENRVTIVFSSKKLTKNLEKFNMISPRSKNLKLPIISNSLLSHLIRGIFDGDGCLMFNKIKKRKKKSEYYYSSFSITNPSRLFLLDIQNILMKNCQLRKTKLIKRKECYELIYGGRLQVQRIMFFLYKNANIYLDRKFKIFKNLMSYSPKLRRKGWQNQFTNF